MSPTILMLLSVGGASVLFIALIVMLYYIAHELAEIGGQRWAYGYPASLLSKIRLGVRAIEVQTGHLAPQVTQLNTGLSAVRDGVKAIDANLAGVIDAVVRQEAK